MVGKKIQFLGFVYEGAFKIGFLEGKIEESKYIAFKKNFDVFIKEKYLSEIDDKGIYGVWEDLKEGKIDFRKINPTEFRGKTVFLYTLAYQQGKLFGEKLKGDIELVRYEILAESEKAGSYRNADLLFIHNKKLYTIDFKLGGADKHILEIFKQSGNDIPYIPFRPYGVSINISTGKLKFADFVESVLKLDLKKEDLHSLIAVRELKGFLQLISYAVDFLVSENSINVRNIDEVNLSLYYPFDEPYSASFFYSGEDLKPYHNRVLELYNEVIKLETAFDSLKKEHRPRELLIHENNYLLKQIKEKIQKREEEVEVIEPGDISSAREDVGKAIEEFFNKKEENVKALCLLHSPGSGKTTQLLNKILSLKNENKEDKIRHVVFYLTTRKQIAYKVENHLLRMKEKIKDKKIHIIHEKKKNYKIDKARKKGDSYEDVGSNSGILQSASEKVKKEFLEHDFIFVIATQQSIVRTAYRNNDDDSTLIHIKRMLTGMLPDFGTFHFILDEVLGYKNGLMAIEGLLDVIKSTKRGHLYILDANIYSANLLKKLLEEYENYKVFPSALVLCDYKEEDTFERKGVNFYCYAKHGYPAPKITLKRKFLNIENPFYSEEYVPELCSNIVKYIEETFPLEERNKYTALVFVQHKEIISKLKQEFEKRGLKTLAITADSNKTQEEVNKESSKEDVIIITSAMSRGVDIIRKHKPVKNIYLVVLNLAIEDNLAEIIQVLSRARGGEETEKLPKDIHLLYVIEEPKEKRLRQYLNFFSEENIENSELLSLILKRITYEEKLYLDLVITEIIKSFLTNEIHKTLVPIPTQHDAKYIENTLSELESIINFLEGIALMEEGHVASDLNKISNLLKNVEITVKDLDKSSYEYYHPYLVFENRKVRFSFSSKNRENLIKILKDKPHIIEILKKHNKEKTEEMLNFIEWRLLPVKDHYLPVLVPSYANVITDYFLDYGGKLMFTINKRIGRGEASVLMGSINPITYCINLNPKEYACIPLGEDYPHKEILSGRFARYPITLLKLILEGGKS